MGTAAKTIAVLVVIAAGAGCRGAIEPLPEVQGGAELALRRGSGWSTVKVRPPYAIGPRVNLKFNRDKVTGNIDSGTMMDNRLGALNLTINNEGIEGSGPYGSVAVDVAEDQNALEFEGTWNGSRVTFKITADSMKGTIPVRRYNMRDPVTGAARQADSILNVTSCQYVLDRITPDGAHEGTSICGGLPEATRLEIPRQIYAWLTRKELVVVLLALLSTPPQTSLEPLP
jgi:hypothetical protein